MFTSLLLVSLILTIILTLLSYMFKKYNFNLEPEQRVFMIISNLLFILLFGLLGSKLLNNPDLVQIIYILSIFYVIWIYITYVIVNYLSSDSNGVLRY
jgi:hypothetical protein